LWKSEQKVEKDKTRLPGCGVATTVTVSMMRDGWAIVQIKNWPPPENCVSDRVLRRDGSRAAYANIHKIEIGRALVLRQSWFDA
jgi:hypothetical protein